MDRATRGRATARARRWPTWAAVGALVLAAAPLAGPASPALSVEAAAPAASLRVVDRAAAVGLRRVETVTFSANPVDYNRDGHQDVWIGYHGQGGRLWKNRGNGTYTWVARAAWPRRNRSGGFMDRHECGWADVDRNGLVDAYCSTGRTLTNIVKRRRGNELWLQRRPGRFTEVGREWGLRDSCGRGRQVVFFDANGDRWPDLFLGNHVPWDDPGDPCDSSRRLPNERSKVFLNVRGRGFRYVAGRWRLPAGVGVRCARRLDFDGDGWDDLLTCSDYDERPRLYRNRRGRGLVDVTARQAFGQVSDVTLADLDEDGDRDVVTAASEGFAYHPDVGGRFGARVWLAQQPAGRNSAVAAADVDRDGDQDVYAMSGQDGATNLDDQLLIHQRTAYVPLPVPSAGGAADEAVPLLPRRHGRPGFLVLNGHGRGTPGPIQLIQAVPR